MPTRSGAASPNPARAPEPTPPGWRRRPLLWIAGAFLLGLLLFALFLFRSGDGDFYRASDDAPDSATRDYAPLPAPLPGGGEETVGLTPPAEGAVDGDGARLVETTPPPTPAVPRPARAPQAAAAKYVEPQRIPEQSPAPSYPVRALRRGEEGVASVRAQIGPDGVPTSVSLASGSGSRDLDRAALDAVRRWRFRPAQEGGRPTVGTVVVPIEFKRE